MTLFGVTKGCRTFHVKNDTKKKRAKSTKTVQLSMDLLFCAMVGIIILSVRLNLVTL